MTIEELEARIKLLEERQKTILKLTDMNDARIRLILEMLGGQKEGIKR